RGVLSVPGGFDRDARTAIRRVHAALVSFSKLPNDETLLRAVLLAADDPATHGFLLEAAFPYRLVPAGASARRRLEALAQAADRAEFDALTDALKERVLAESAERCDETLGALLTAEDLEDLQRGLRGLEGALDRDLKLLDDLGGDP